MIILQIIYACLYYRTRRREVKQKAGGLRRPIQIGNLRLCSGQSLSFHKAERRGHPRIRSQGKWVAHFRMELGTGARDPSPGLRRVQDEGFFMGEAGSVSLQRGEARALPEIDRKEECLRL